MTWTLGTDNDFMDRLGTETIRHQGPRTFMTWTLRTDNDFMDRLGTETVRDQDLYDLDPKDRQ